MSSAEIMDASQRHRCRLRRVGWSSAGAAPPWAVSASWEKMCWSADENVEPPLVEAERSLLRDSALKLRRDPIGEAAKASVGAAAKSVSQVEGLPVEFGSSES